MPNSETLRPLSLRPEKPIHPREGDYEFWLLYEMLAINITVARLWNAVCECNVNGALGYAVLLGWNVKRLPEPIQQGKMPTKPLT